MSQGGRRNGTCESGRQRDLDRWVRELEESGQVGQGAGRIWTCGSGNWKNLGGWGGVHFDRWIEARRVPGR